MKYIAPVGYKYYQGRYYLTLIRVDQQETSPRYNLSRHVYVYPVEDSRAMHPQYRRDPNVPSLDFYPSYGRWTGHHYFRLPVCTHEFISWHRSRSECQDCGETVIS